MTTNDFATTQTITRVTDNVVTLIDDLLTRHADELGQELFAVLGAALMHTTRLGESLRRAERILAEKENSGG